MMILLWNLFDLKTKTATDATESIVFDDRPKRKIDDDDDSGFYLNKGTSPPDNTTSLLPTASTNRLTFSRFVAALVEKQYSDYNNNITTTTADSSQPPNFSDDKPTRELDDDFTSKFIFDLAAKIDMDVAMDTTDFTVFDDKPNQKLDDDDDNLEIEYRQFAQPVNTYYMNAFFFKLQCLTCQKDRRANDHTVLSTKNSHPDKCTSKSAPFYP